MGLSGHSQELEHGNDSEDDEQGQGHSFQKNPQAITPIMGTAREDQNEEIM